MGTTRVTITLPADLVEKARTEYPNLSRLVAQALAEYLWRRRREAAETAFGAWRDRWPEDVSSVELVMALRADPEGGRFAASG